MKAKHPAKAKQNSKDKKFNISSEKNTGKNEVFSLRNMAVIAVVLAAAVAAHLIIDEASTRYFLSRSLNQQPVVKNKAGKEAIPHIELEEAYALFLKNKAVFVDARSEWEYEQAHIKGAICIPSGSTIGKIAAMKKRMRGKILVTYCHGVGCHLSDKTANALYDAGYRKIKIFFGGWNEWTQAGYPLDKKE